MGAGRSIGILTILNLAGAALAVVQSVVVAWYFGTSRGLEVFFAASTLQTLLFSLTQTGQLTEVFLPVYHRLREDRGPQAARAAFAVIVNWMVLGVCVLAGAMWLLAGPVMAMLVPGFTSGDQHSGAWTFRLLLPLLPIQVYFSLAATLVNAERQFGRPEAIGVFSRLVMVVATACLAGHLGAGALVAAAWVGAGIQMLGCPLMLRRSGYRHRLIFRSEGFRAAAVFGRTATTLGYVGATQVYAIAFNAALSVLPQGTFAVFKYVQTLCARTNSVLLRPVSVVFFTHFSESLSRGAGDLRQLARSALSKSLLVLTPMIVAAAVAGRSLLGGLWGSHQFAPSDLALAAAVLTLLLGLLAASALGQIARKMTMSLGMVGRQYTAAAGVQVVAAVLSWTIIPPWGVGGAMAVVAFSELALAAAPLAILAIWRRELAVFYPPPVAARWLLSGAAGAACGWALAWLLPAGLPAGRWAELLRGLLLASSAAGVSLAAAGLLGVGEVRKLAAVLTSRLRRGSSRQAEPPELAVSPPVAPAIDESQRINELTRLTSQPVNQSTSQPINRLLSP